MKSDRLDLHLRSTTPSARQLQHVPLYSSSFRTPSSFLTTSLWTACSLAAESPSVMARHLPNNVDIHFAQRTCSFHSSTLPRPVSSAGSRLQTYVPGLLSSHESNQHPHSYCGIAHAFVALAIFCVASYLQTCPQARAGSSLVDSMLVFEQIL